eukprot:1161539-Pelagomonas_calceolata.AAC.4
MIDPLYPLLPIPHAPLSTQCSPRPSTYTPCVMSSRTCSRCPAAALRGSLSLLLLTLPLNVLLPWGPPDVGDTGPGSASRSLTTSW